MSPCPINLSELEMEPEDSGADVASIEDHGLALRSRWQWILDQSIEGMEIVSNFTRQLEDFEVKHLEMQKFLEDGRDRLAEEKPVASTSGQIKAQLENCTVRKYLFGDYISSSCCISSIVKGFHEND